MLNILIVEDDPVFRARFAGIVETCADFQLLAAVGSCAEARACLASAKPDVLLCDLGLPDGDGADIVREACRAYPDLDAMVITVFGDEGHVLRSLEAGATGYLLKDSLPENFVATTKMLHEGGSPINPIIARRLLKRFGGLARESPRGTDRHAEPTTPSLLSEREGEGEVLQLVAKGYNVAEIGGLLKISPHTVSSHIKNIYRKLKASTRGEAVYEASRRQLI